MSSGAAGSAEPDELWVAHLHDALRSAGAELSPRELCDALWLALHEPPRRAAAAVPETDVPLLPGSAPGSRSHPEPPEHRERAGAEPAPGEIRRPVYALTGTRDGGAPGAPVRIPGVRGLRHPLGIARALRALKRTVPSTHRYELDETATAEAIADSGVLDAVFRPAADRWLHLLLAVDDGPSMRVWRDTVGELADALTVSGIFRSVSVTPLAASVPLAGGRTAVLAVTDGVADHWYTGAAHEQLAGLARRAPTAVLHLFPTRLWNGTGLAAEPMIVHTTGPAPPNSRLTTHDPWLPLELSLRPALPVPVLELDEPSLRPWADLIASHGGVAALRVIDAERPPDAVPFGEGGTGGQPGTATERVHGFRATASPLAYELAGHLAAVDPLTLPVMRLVQAAALPDSSPVCLAEVLLSGLMHVDDPLEDQDVFAFAPDVRGVLHTVIRTASAQRTVDAVSDFIAPRLGRTPDFPAVIADRTGTLNLPRGGEPLAVLAPANGSRAGAYGRVWAGVSLWGRGTHNLPVRRTTRWLPALEDDVVWVGESLRRAGDGPVVLCGPAGSDKTTVALEYAHRRLSDYALVWWVDAHDAHTMEGGIAGLAEVMIPEPAFTGLEDVGAVERALQGLEFHADWLLVLDHVTEDAEVARLVDRIGAASGHVLVTTRCEVRERTAASRDLTPAYRVRNDALTGLRNGRTIRDQLAALLCAEPQADHDPHHRHLRLPSEDPETGEQGLAVLFCTLHGFESIRARYGHDTGDAVLVEVARRLRDAVRDDDTVARVGEDTFVILTGRLNRADAQDLAARLQAGVTQTIRAEDRAVRVGVHIGTGWALCGMDADRVIASANEGSLGHARDTETLLLLTDALCDLECMEDPQGRTTFAELLGEQLSQRIDIGGVGLREDVITLVSAALSVPGGQHVLIRVVRLCAGVPAAEELARLIATAPGLSMPSVLSVTEEDSARALLRAATAELSAARLREALTHDLNGLSLPTGRSPEELFVWVLDLNAQPDGLPPAVLLVERAARLSGSPVHRSALAAWAEAWAENAGLSEALRHRRTAAENT